MFLKLPFTASFSDLFIIIQYAVFSKSFRTICVSLCMHLYIYIDSTTHHANICICIYICAHIYIVFPFKTVHG